MLIVAGFTLLAGGLVLLFVKARTQRWFGPVAALFVSSAILFALHARAWTQDEKRLNDSLVDSCRYLESELNAIVFDFQTVMISDKQGVRSPVDVMRVRDKYAKLIGSRRDWLQMCVPDATRCLPTALDEHTVGKIERAAVAIGARRRCP